MKTNYYEWIYLFFQKDPEALPNLMAYFRPLTMTVIRNRLNVYYQESELADFLDLSGQVMVDCLYRCRTDRITRFDTYYSHCLNNRVIDASKHNVSHSLEAHYPTVHLDAFVREDIAHYVSETIPNRRMNVHDDVMVGIRKLEIEKSMKLYFTDYEISILKLKQIGYTNAEIAEARNISVRKVRYILLKIKKWFLHIDI
ncbi:hypothetical protein [Catenisphaera adipataccumulans]|jgi:DNA-directed RNA polymerase specialized sigma24 family protein|uniref:DNA-directed RNA polymerase specialized sigma24 family protein n=1 Tax=Catenisphaera adipataccumulans TaxID=700500 RepID=A0A7W8CXW6_9FIRM|nr:hypothetical protein [Catenisphaera adipataccumulans]MBB5183643.1 DNA-directed RNA polymerase specialized sigma24 family protein [Catenisphaera adipataccumulans]